jgi:hypothetical protein
MIKVKSEVGLVHIHPKMNGRVEVKLHSFLTAAVDGADWSLHAPAALVRRRSPVSIR